MRTGDGLTQRLEVSMAALNARIARLAMALDVDLNDRVAVATLMVKQQSPAVAEERRSAGADASHVSVSPERRQARQREELRGLLLLRFQMEVTSLTNNGWNVTREAMKQAQEHLIRQGFKPGADGLGLDDFFDLA